MAYHHHDPSCCRKLNEIIQTEKLRKLLLNEIMAISRSTDQQALPILFIHMGGTFLFDSFFMSFPLIMNAFHAFDFLHTH